MAATMEFHEAANIFPMDDDTMDELVKDIRTNGLQVPIETLDGQIIDGRRRFTACRMAGKEPQFRVVKVDDPIAYVLSLNLHRRHLSPAQLSMVGAKATGLRDKLEAEAKDRQKESGKTHGRGKVVENLPPPISAGKTRDAIGKVVGVSGKSIDAASRVLKQGTPKLIKAVESDHVAVSTAARASSFSPAEQDALADRAAEAAKNGVKRPRQMERDDQDTEDEQIERKGVGVIRANEAINCLIRIPKNDQLRKRGFQIVTDWIKANK